MKQLSKQLLAAKKSAQGAFLKLVLNKDSKCWSEFHKYTKRRKGNRENIPAIKDCNGRNITESIEKANSLNFYYYSVFGSEDNFLKIQDKISSELFTIDTKIIRKMIAAIRKNKSVGVDGFSIGILKLGGEAIIPYLARLLDITMNNCTLPGDWKKATVIPIHKGSDRSLVTNYRPVSLTSVVCKQMEHVIASYLRQVWDKNYLLYEGQHGFRPGYSCESQVTTVCQDIADSLDNEDRIDPIVIEFSEVFDLVPHGRLLTKIANSGVGSRVILWIREFLLGRMQRIKVGAHLSEEVRATSRDPQGSVLGPLLFLAYVNDILRNIETTIRLYADDCVIYRKIINKEDIENVQKDLYRLGEWAVENAMKINPSKSKAVRFTRARLKDPLDYSLTNTSIPETSSCK